MDCGSLQTKRFLPADLAGPVAAGWRRIDRKFRDRTGHECGAIRGNMIVVVVDCQPNESRASAASQVRPTSI
jgi:hypothetical protein